MGGEASARLEPYVPARVPVIIENINDTTIPIERHSDLTEQQRL